MKINLKILIYGFCEMENNHITPIKSCTPLRRVGLSKIKKRTTESPGNNMGNHTSKIPLLGINKFQKLNEHGKLEENKHAMKSMNVMESKDVMKNEEKVVVKNEEIKIEKHETNDVKKTEEVNETKMCVAKVEKLETIKDVKPIPKVKYIRKELSGWKVEMFKEIEMKCGRDWMRFVFTRFQKEKTPQISLSDLFASTSQQNRKYKSESKILTLRKIYQKKFYATLESMRKHNSLDSKRTTDSSSWKYENEKFLRQLEAVKKRITFDDNSVKKVKLDESVDKNDVEKELKDNDVQNSTETEDRFNVLRNITNVPKLTQELVKNEIIPETPAESQNVCATPMKKTPVEGPCSSTGTPNAEKYLSEKSRKKYSLSLTLTPNRLMELRKRKHELTKVEVTPKRSKLSTPRPKLFSNVIDLTLDNEDLEEKSDEIEQKVFADTIICKPLPKFIDLTEISTTNETVGTTDPATIPVNTKSEKESTVIEISSSSCTPAPLVATRPMPIPPRVIKRPKKKKLKQSFRYGDYYVMKKKIKAQMEEQKSEIERIEAIERSNAETKRLIQLWTEGGITALEELAESCQPKLNIGFILNQLCIPFDLYGYDPLFETFDPKYD